jgi:hypothetical protein
MRFLALVTSVCVLSVAGSLARADVLSFTPNPPDLYDLDHGKYYTWGISATWLPDQVVVSASLSFKQIRDWTTEQNVLYLHLLDQAPLGVRTYTDNEGGGDNFAGQGILLTTLCNLPATPQNLTYHFTAGQVAALNTYAADGRFALGLDPDCHFYNDGVTLSLATDSSQVPEPGTMVLVLAGAGLAIARRRRGA